MVNNQLNLSAYEGVPPSDDQASRTIMGGPLYDMAAMLLVLAQGESAIVPWTRKCISDLKKYEMAHDDVVDLIRTALARGNFKGSEWCVNKPGGHWAACDSYQVFIKQWVAAAHKDMVFEYYVKFAIGKTGKVVLTISCHLSEDR